MGVGALFLIGLPAMVSFYTKVEITGQYLLDSTLSERPTGYCMKRFSLVIPEAVEVSGEGYVGMSACGVQIEYASNQPGFFL